MRDLETKFPRSLWIRLIIYIALGHVLAGFLYLLFAIAPKG